MTNIVEGKNGLLRMQVFAIAYFIRKLYILSVWNAWRIRLKIGVQKEKMKFCETANDNRCCFAKYKKNDMVLFNDMCTQF